MIFDGDSTKNMVLYPSGKPSIGYDTPLCDEFELEKGNVQPILTIEKYLCFKNKIEDDSINSFISNPPSVS